MSGPPGGARELGLTRGDTVLTQVLQGLLGTLDWAADTISLERDIFMGTWGPGNLENDYALDELGERAHHLVASLMERARGKSSRECDDYDYTTLFVDFEMLFALDAQGLLECGLPSPEEVDELKRDYLQEWDVNVDALEPSAEFKRDRRRCILRTFNRFKRICGRKAKESESQAARAAESGVMEAPGLEDLLEGVGITPCPVFKRLSISLPKTWTAHSSNGWHVAADFLLVHRFVDPSSRRFIARSMRIDAAAKGAAEAALEDHAFDVQEVFFATGTSRVPGIPRVADPYILLVRLRSADGAKVPDAYDLAFGAEEALSPLYQGDGGNVSSPYGVDTPEELSFLGIQTFRRSPRGTPTDLHQHQDLYFHPDADGSLLVLEYGSLGNASDDFPDQVLVHRLAASLRPAHADA